MGHTDHRRDASADSTTAIAAGGAQQIVFIDGGVAGAATLAAGVQPGVRVVVLNPAGDELQQIAATLDSFAPGSVGAISIVAHGNDGALVLGNEVLSTATLAEHATALAAIGTALAPGGVLQLYGCDVAQDATGLDFLRALATTTGASVAAATHLVGAASDGGSWALDAEIGTARVSSPFTAATTAAYPDLLSASGNQLFVAFNAFQFNSNDTRLEQLGGVSASTYTSSTDLQDASQSGNGNFVDLQGVAVDAPLGKYFLVNSDGETINEIVAGNVSGGAPTVLYATPNIVDYELGGLALDQPAGKIYFSLASDGSTPAGIYSISTSGGSATAVVTGQGMISPLDLSLDLSNNLVFFVDSAGIGSGVNNLDVGFLNTGSLEVLTGQLGSTVEDELNTGNSNNAQLLGVAVDAVNDNLYFTASNGGTTSENFIYKVHYTVSAGQVTLGAVTTLYAGSAAGEPGSIVLDVQDGIFYVGEKNNGAVDVGSLTGVGALTQLYQQTGTPDIQPGGLFLLSSPTVTASGAVTFVFGHSAVTLDSSPTLTNADGQDIAGATVKITSGGLAGDTLAATTTGTSISASYSAGTLTLSGTDTLAHYQSVLGSVTFTSSSDTAGSRTVSWTVTDGIITSATPTSTVDIHALPTIVAGASVSLGSNPSVLLDPGLTVTAPSSSTLAGATITIGSYLTGDTLSVGTSGGLSASYANGTLTLSGVASVATYQTALESISYSFIPSGGDPTDGNTDRSRTITWSVNDGTVASTSVTSSLSVACFATGTNIATLRGEVAVEALRPGDQVRLARGGSAPVVWLGHRHLRCDRHPRPWDVQPVRVRAHAFGPGQPARDLILSPDHALFTGAALVPVRYLLNGASIVQEAATSVTYWHVELAAHDVLLAEGLPAESYLDTGNRAAFANGGAVVQAAPSFARAAWSARACAPLVLSGPALVRAKAALLARLPALGYAVSDNPALAAAADGVALTPQRDGTWWCYALPPGARRLLLRSRRARPAEMKPDSDDTRLLGIALDAFWLDGVAVPLDAACFASGWLPPEPEWRWSDGAAILDVHGASVVEFRLAPLLRYVVPLVSREAGATASRTPNPKVFGWEGGQVGSGLLP